MKGDKIYIIESEIKKLVRLFLETNESDKELSLRTGISSSTVGRRLTNAEKIVELFDLDINRIPGIECPPDQSYGTYIYDLVRKRRKENILKGRSKGGKIGSEKVNLRRDEFGKFISDSTPLVDLSQLYQSEEKIYKFLAHATLTFRLTLPTLSELLGMTEDEVFSKLMEHKPELSAAFEYLFVYEMLPQRDPRSNFLRYYMQLLNAKKTRDPEEQKRLLALISDKDAKKIKDTRSTESGRRQKLDIGTIIRYQLKYAIKSVDIAHMFHIGYSVYAREVNLFLADKPDLRCRYDNIMASTELIYFTPGGKR